MASAAKPEYPPLLPVGLYAMTLDEFRAFVVTPFSLSVSRPPLMQAIETICGALTDAQVESAVWIDGSFLTKKIDPADADLVVCVESSQTSASVPDKVAALDKVNQGQFPGCHSYVQTNYPDGHPRYWVGDFMQAYWKKQFGFSRSEEFKGIAVIKTPL